MTVSLPAVDPTTQDDVYFMVSRLTLGPTSLSEVILEKSSAVWERTWGWVELQKRSSR